MNAVSEQKSVFTAGVTLAGVSVVTSLLVFLSQRILLSTFSIADNGAYFVERRVAELVLIILVDFGMNATAMRRINTHPERRKEILASLLVFRLAMLIPATVIAMAAGWLLDYNLGNILTWSLAMILMSRSALIRYALELPRRSAHRFAIPGAVTILDGVLYYVLVYVFRNELTTSLAMWLMVFAAIPGFIITIVSTDLSEYSWSNARMREITSLIRHALPVLISVVLLNVHDKIDGFFLGQISGKHQVGVFGAAYSVLSPLAASIPMTISFVVSPLIARFSVRDDQGSRTVAVQGLRFVIAAALLVCSTLSVLSSVLIDVISDNVYAGYESEFELMIWVGVPIFIQSYLYEVQIALGAQRTILISNILLLVTTILGCLVLIPPFGAIGAIAAKMSSLAVSVISVLYAFHKTIGGVITKGNAMQYGTAGMIVVAVAVFMPLLVQSPWDAPVVFCSTLLVLFLFGIAKRSDLTRISNAFRGTT